MRPAGFRALRSHPGRAALASAPAATAALALVSAALVLVAPARGAAQGIPFVRAATQPIEPCPAVAPAEATDAARQDARRLRDQAAASVLAGDAGGARDRLARAVALDPTDADLAYRLARAHEELGEPRAAWAAYCRYRALARTEQDVAEAESRLAALGPVLPSGTPDDPAMLRFQAGVARAAAGDFAGADEEFTATLERWPSHAATLLDRAAVRTVLGLTGPALADLDRYAAAAPAPDRAALAARDALHAGRRDPSSVALAGALPGGAQFTTGRPVAGALVAAIAVAGVALALESRTVQREQRFTDPFGNPYTELVQVTESPRRALGVSVSVAAIVGGALEGFLRATAGRRELLRLQRETRDAIRRR